MKTSFSLSDNFLKFCFQIFCKLWRFSQWFYLIKLLYLLASLKTFLKAHQSAILPVASSNIYVFYIAVKMVVSYLSLIQISFDKHFNIQCTCIHVCTFVTSILIFLLELFPIYYMHLFCVDTRIFIIRIS